MYNFSDKSVIESRTCSEVVFCQIALSNRATLIEKLNFSQSVSQSPSNKNLIRDLQIIRRVKTSTTTCTRILSTKQCTRANQRRFGWKMWQPSSVYNEFQRECRSSKLSNVRSFIIFRSGEGITSFTKGNSVNFSS